MQVLAGELRNDAGILGAAAQAFERLGALMPFSLAHRDPGCDARTGSLALDHGTVSTPCFMPVGTNATVKAMRNSDLEEIGVNLILGNTYHLYLRPGREVIKAAGGLHEFMGWRHNILTDSGGYQVFSPLLLSDGGGRGRVLPLPHRRLLPSPDPRGRGRHPGNAGQRHPDAAG